MAGLPIEYRHLGKAASNCVVYVVCILLWAPCIGSAAELAQSGSPPPSVDRSPVDLARSPDGEWIVTANQISNSVSLIHKQASAWQLVDEVNCGEYPVDLEFTPDGKTLLVTSQWDGKLHLLQIVDQKLKKTGSIHLGMDPHGIAISSDGRKAYVGLVATAQVAEVDLQTQTVTRHFECGRWPRYLTLTPDGSRLAVGSGGDGNIKVLDTETGKELYEEPLANGTNLGQMLASSDGKYAYFPWMVYRTNPISVQNIQRGWILASRIGRVRLDGPAYREAISLDVPRKAVADPQDLVISNDGKRLIASSSGTHELLVYRLPDLPFVAIGGPGDLIDRKLQNDRERFYRIEVGGRPMGMRIDDDHRTVFVANYLRNSMQVVDLETQQVESEIQLGGPKEKTAARLGMEIFYDARYSLDQWYSCHSCHQDGGVNARRMDTMNDGTNGTLKTVLPLYDVTKTFPWTWHGWQKNLTDSMHKSITSTMIGEPPTDQEKQALIEFLSTLKRPPNPFRLPNGDLSEAAKRGKEVFYSSKAACADCHTGPHYSDGKIHDVGLGRSTDHYRGYNTPSLLGTYRKVRWLHNGKAKTLERVVNDLHSPEKVNGEDALTEQESTDLIAFLKSL
ncbi:MAG: beta-propeller fold lactonase family protein [Rubripirellula sp.]